MFRPFYFVLLTISICGSVSHAGRPYEPVRPSPLAESWRWHAQEALEGMTLIDCFENNAGALWFVSEDGLVEYDGFKVQSHPTPDGLSLATYRSGVLMPDNTIYMLLQGEIVEFRGGSFRGIYSFTEQYDMTSAQAIRTPWNAAVFGTPNGVVSVKNGQVEVISEANRRASFLLLDSLGNLWTNKVSSGLLLRYADFSDEGPLEDSRWESFRVIPDSGAHLTLAELPDGTLWCANDNPFYGLSAFNLAAGEWEPLDIDAEAEEKVHHAVHIAPDGTVIIYGDKRILVHKNGQTLELNIDNFDFPLTAPFARSLASGSMIVGGRRETVYLVDCSTSWWESFQGLNFFCTDKSGRQWFISFDGGIVCRDPSNDTWLRYDDRDGAINTPLTLISTRDGKVWAAGRHDNVAALSIFHDGVWDLRMHPEMGTRFSHQSLVELSDGTVLLGGGDTAAENLPGRGGLIKYETNGAQYTTTHYAPPRVPFRVVGIDEAPDGTIWIGGSLLHRLEDFKATPLDSLGEFENSWIDSFILLETGELWVGQWGVGIHVLEGGNWTYSRDRNRSLARGVVALTEDPAFPGQVWAGTSEGLFNLDSGSWVGTPLDPDLAMLREGGGVFGSPDGTVWINTSSRNWNFRNTGEMPGRGRFEPYFRTTAFKRYEIAPDTAVIEYEPKVHEPGLSHFQWSGRCQWSLAQSDELSYSYRVDGGEWTPFSRRTEVVLETQSNGLHTFEVKARTPYGMVDATPASVPFEVIPLLWKQPWFILLSIVILVVLVALIVIIVRQRIEHLLALEEYKIQFFTNISHELRTPLMVILGPLESLMKHVDEKGKKHLDIAYRNARKLVGLLDRLLDFRKAQLGKIEASPQVLDIILFIRQEMESIRPLAARKEQALEFHPGREGLHVAFDPKLVEVVFDNLLTNAIKYTPRGGSIRVYFDVLGMDNHRASLRLRVEDTGPGIPPKELEKVFDPFYQVRASVGGKSHSTGIGLAHTKSVVEAVGGTIRAESPANPGSPDFPGARFVVEIFLPLKAKPGVPVQPGAAVAENEPDPDEEEFAAGKKPLMLIVEDHEDIREFLETEFRESHTILLAENGEEGLRIAQERIPDIIVSDVLMPVMDGRDLCKQIKKDPRTSHIPVILLTALKSEAHELEGLETGADDYITKPVNVALMRRRLENILLNRHKVREFINSQTRSIAINKDELPVNKVDQEFLGKFMDTIEDNLRNETFDVEDLAGRMFMSRMTLYRKVKALTGESPGNIIRTVRLKKAAQYLETGSWTVSQVIEQVGFLDLSHFSRSFKKAYGCTPTEYIERYSLRAVRAEEEIRSSE